MTDKNVAKVAKGGCNNETARETQKYNYRFTFNNYNPDNVASYCKVLDDICNKYIFQSEVGEEKETPHLQGFINLKKKLSKKSVNKLFDNKLWLGDADDPKGAIAYSQKTETYDGKFRCMKGITLTLPLDYFKPNKDYPYQLELEKILLAKAEKRTIYWVYDVGNQGKSEFARYMEIVYPDKVIGFENGKTADIAFMINTMKNKVNLTNSPIFILDIPRSGIKSFNYQCIETLKNGKIVSPKYESSRLLFNTPHILVFANEQPEFENMTMDRWKIFEIIDKKLIAKKIERNEHGCLELNNIT